MDKEQQERAGGCAAMGNIHFVQAAEIGLGPFRAGGQEQGAGHEDDDGRTENFPSVCPRKVFPAIIDRREGKPDYNIQDDEGDDGVVTKITFHF